MSDEYEDMVYVYDLVPSETWKRYELLEIEGLREQILLEKASKKLLKKWRTKRPRLLGKRKKNNESTTNN
ncbi:MAG: hypothetical protein V3V68_05190 [Nitrosomonadaceae bacterium]